MYQLIDGQARTGSGGEDIELLDPSTGEELGRVDLASTQDVDDAVAAAGRAFEDWSRVTPAERSTLLGKTAAILDGMAEEFAQVEMRAVRQADPVSREFDVPGSDRQRRVLRRRRPHLERQASAEYSADHTSHDPAGADRRRRVDLAVELPAPDGRVEDPPGGGRGQHDRPQTLRAHAADLGDPLRQGLR
jgi:acyl-CoA reductase-like NAD-dependent aldehyde dehydrogenase